MDEPNRPIPPPERSGVTDHLRGIVEDIKTIARDEVALTRTEIGHSAKLATADAVAILLGGIVALIGLGLLCVSAVVALRGAIDSLVIRLLLMAAVYLVVGAALAAVFAARLRRDATPDLKVPRDEARRTIATTKEALRHG